MPDKSEITSPVGENPNINSDTTGAHTDGIFYTYANQIPESIWKNWS